MRYCLRMQILLVDGFYSQDEIPALVKRALENRGHDVMVLNLIDEGFDAFMSDQERLAYHEVANLITNPQQQSAKILKEVDALFICYPMVEGLFPPHVKSWFERVFIPGISFVFSPKGRVKRALKNLRKIAIVSFSDSGQSPLRRRTDPNRSLLRAIRMNSHLLCRSHLLHLQNTGNLKEQIANGIDLIAANDFHSKEEV